MADEKEPVALEPFTFEIFIGVAKGKQKGVKLRVELDQPASAIALAPVIAVIGWPHVTGISIIRETTGDYVLRAPIMDVMRKLAPEINRVVGGPAIPLIPLAGDKDLDAIAGGEMSIADAIKNKRKGETDKG